MSNLYIKIIFAFALSLSGLQAQSTVITIDANYCTANNTTYATVGVDDYKCWQGIDPHNPTVSSFTTMTGLPSLSGLKEFYKNDVETGEEEGDLSGSYNTVYFDEFGNPSSDPSAALITYVEGANSSACPDCYLLVKDGKQDPIWYLFDIGYWDGEMALDLQHFWLDNGAISHVAIWGVETNVPEPGVAGLLAIGLLAMVAVRRRTKV